MRKLASIAKVATSVPHENADRLSVVTLEGKAWKVVTGRDEFKPGDLVVYFEIDSYLPADDARYGFLAERCLKKFCLKSGEVVDQGIRIKTVKLRGVVSQGLVMPLNSFPEVTDQIVNIPVDGEEGMNVFPFLTDPNGTGYLEEVVGHDVTDILKVRHYDEIAEALRPVISGRPVPSDAMGPFPTAFIPKTDEERIQNLADWFDTMKGETFEVTEKNDGMSVTAFYSPTIDPEHPFGVCSRNLRLKEETQNGDVPTPWRVMRKLMAEDRIAAMCYDHGTQLALQGELVGPGINGNRDLYTDYEWHVFRIWDIGKQRFVDPCTAMAMALAYGFEYVPVLGYVKPFDEFGSVDEILKYAEGTTKKHGREREGLVFKRIGKPNMVSFKAVSNRYLLGQKD